MSVLVNAKSMSHRKTHQVEPGGTGRKFMHLTRGDLVGESLQEVSRSHSSEDRPGNREVAKGRRTRKANNVRAPIVESSETNRSWAKSNFLGGDHPLAGGFRFWSVVVGGKVGGGLLRQSLLTFNRRMRKTACPVVWEGAGSIPAPTRSVSEIL